MSYCSVLGAQHNRFLGISILLCILCSVPNAASAWCYARLGGFGPQVSVQEEDGPSQHWAHAYFHPVNGYPIIVYGPGYYALPEYMREFTRHHECGHLVLFTRDEIAANCFALRRLRRDGLTREEEDEIGEFHAEIGPLPPQYGGSGLAFWRMTLRRCGG